MSLANDVQEVARVIDSLEEFGAANGIPAEQSLRFGLALDELITNIVSYGLAGRSDAVITLANIPAVQRMWRRVRLTSVPSVAAWSTPKSSALSGFTRRMAIARAISTGITNHGKRCKWTLLKVPMPH